MYAEKKNVRFFDHGSVFVYINGQLTMVDDKETVDMAYAPLNIEFYDDVDGYPVRKPFGCTSVITTVNTLEEIDAHLAQQDSE